MAVPEFYSGKILYPSIAVLLGLSGLFGLAILPRLATAASSSAIGKPAPEAVVQVVANGEGAGEEIKLSDLKGKPVLLDFWATWCGPCAVEAPIVDRLSRRFEKKGLVVLGVNTSDSPEAIRAYTRKKGLSYRMVNDPHGKAQEAYGVKQLPSLVVIDRQGNVQAFLVGVVDEAALSEILGAVL